MLDTLRRHSQSYLVYLFFGIIIVVFVFFFGPQSKGCSPGEMDVVATVGPVSIGSLQVEQLFGRISQSERGLPDREQIPPGTRRYQLTEDLVAVHLLAQEARAAGMAVSDEQFAAYIQDRDRNPDFRYYTDRTGSFDYDQYQMAVPGVFGVSLQEYESWKEDELLAQEYIRLLGRAITVTPGEVEAIHRMRDTQYNLEYIRFDPEVLADLLAISDANVRAALEADRTRFEEYYAQHTADFEQPRTLRVRRIFFRLPGESEPEARAEARSRFETALELVQSDPSSFADVAREYSESTDADEGGDMGLKTAEAYEAFPFLRDRLDEIELGSIETYESQATLQIFRIEEDNPATVPTFDEVADEVARVVLESERGDEPVRDLAEWVLERAQSGMTLQQVAEEYTREHAQATPGGGDVQAEAALENAEAEPESAEEAEPPAAVEGEPSAGETEASEGETEPPEAVEPAFEVQQTGLFSLDERGMDLSQFGPQYAGQFGPPRDPYRIPGIGEVPALARDLGNLTDESPVAPQVYEESGSFIVARLLEFEPASEEIDPETFDEIEQSLWQDKVRALFGNWQARLLFHQPVAMGALIRERLDAAIASGDVEFNQGYFVNPEPTEPAE